MIGGRCRFFHQKATASYDFIPPMSDFSDVEKKLHEHDHKYGLRDKEHALRKEAGIHEEDIRARIGRMWKPFSCLHDAAEASISPFNLLDASDRPRINKLFTWVQGLAMQRGQQESRF